MSGRLQTREFPDEHFACDPAAQSRLDGRAGWKRRQYLTCAVGVGITISAVILGGYLVNDPMIWSGWTGFGLFSIYALVLGVMHPKLVCGSCGGMLEKRWVRGEGEMEDLFLVCNCCKKYVFAHEVRS